MPRLIDADKLFNWGDHKLSDAVKYGNANPEQRAWSYSTLMMYEIADEINSAPTVDGDMTLNEYQSLAQRTSKYKGDPHRIFKQIDNGAKGLCGETGEIMDLLKKHDHQGHELDVERMVDELGDVLWYAAELATGLGTTLEAVAQHNVDKLRQRYPDGFEASRSVNREA